MFVKRLEAVKLARRPGIEAGEEKAGVPTAGEHLSSVLCLGGREDWDSLLSPRWQASSQLCS